MPYQGERASRLAHVSIVRNEAVREAMDRWEVAQRTTGNKSEVQDSCRQVGDLAGEGLSDLVIATVSVDGSGDEIEVTRDYPSARVGYMRIAGSCLSLARFADSQKDRFVDTRKLRQSYDFEAIEMVLPSSGIVSKKSNATSLETWRQEITRFLVDHKFNDSPDTLADALFALYGTPGNPASTVPLRACPVCRTVYLDGNVVQLDLNGGTCPDCRAQLYLGDVLRTSGEWRDEGSNFTSVTRLMNICERLMMLSYMDALFRENFMRNQNPFLFLRSILFVTDGPLALFGPVAPIKRRFEAYHSALARGAEEHDAVSPLLVGLEKSGPFWEHGQKLKNLMQDGDVMMLKQEYINKITGRPLNNRYGIDEFYGRRFFYKTTCKDILVITVPPRAGVAAYGTA